LAAGGLFGLFDIFDASRSLDRNILFGYFAKQQTIDAGEIVMPKELLLDNPSLIEAQSAVFKALGHPARLRMVRALGQGEKCVCELRDLVDLDMSTVSKHLSVLRNAGVVASEKRGNWMHYRLVLACVPGFLSCLEQHL
jgi:ArsR family transcriptional regulator